MNLAEYCIEAAMWLTCSLGRRTNEDILENEFVSIYLLKMELWQFFREIEFEKKNYLQFPFLELNIFPVKLSEIVLLLNIQDVICNHQGGRKVILDGGSLFIGRNFENGFFPLFQFFYSIKAKKMGAPRDTRGPQFRPP